jgi:hypothetical protein
VSIVASTVRVGSVQWQGASVRGASYTMGFIWDVTLTFDPGLVAAWTVGCLGIWRIISRSQAMHEAPGCPRDARVQTVGPIAADTVERPGLLSQRQSRGHRNRLKMDGRWPSGPVQGQIRVVGAVLLSPVLASTSPKWEYMGPRIALEGPSYFRYLRSSRDPFFH